MVPLLDILYKQWGRTTVEIMAEEAWAKLFRWLALRVAVRLFSAPCLKEWMAAVPCRMQATWGHFKPSAQQCYQAAELLLLSVSHHYSSGAKCRRRPLRQAVFCCILMCASQLNAGPSIRFRSCLSTADARMLPSAGAPRGAWESREAPQEVTSKERERN